MTDTKERILDTAERLFAEQGYSATSLRSIISEAGVNLAAVHYHFRSKEALLETVILRRTEPVNRIRLAMLDECEREAGDGTPSLERVLEAFLLPTFQLARDIDKGGGVFVRLMGRLHAEGDLLPGILKKHCGEVIARFWRGIWRALPEVPPEELFWRLHFAIGAMSQALRGIRDLEGLATEISSTPEPEILVRRLISFLSAGFRAPLPAAAQPQIEQEITQEI
jgi:AcrR family transcriptional regulator